MNTALAAFGVLSVASVFAGAMNELLVDLWISPKKKRDSSEDKTKVDIYLTNN